MKSLMNVMTYGLIAGASMYGGYLLGSSNKRKKRSSVQKNNTNK